MAPLLERVFNFRDAGGLPLEGGGQLRRGLLFRSGDLSRASERDVRALRDLGLRLVCDLRAPEECARRVSRVRDVLRVVNVPLHGEEMQARLKKRLLVSFLLGEAGGERYRDFARAYYRHLALERRASVREAVVLLAADGHLPALVHCTAGKDRTGFLAAVIQLLVGVPRERVLTEYLRTNEAMEPRLGRWTRLVRLLSLFQVEPDRVRLLSLAQPEQLEEALRAILGPYGTAARYLSEGCGVPEDALAALRARLIS